MNFQKSPDSSGREDKTAEIQAKRPNIKGDELAKMLKGMETGNTSFSNKTDWTLRKVYEEDHALLEDNFRAYINSFSKNVDDIIDHFNYRVEKDAKLDAQLNIIEGMKCHRLALWKTYALSPI